MKILNISPILLSLLLACLGIIHARQHSVLKDIFQIFATCKYRFITFTSNLTKFPQDNISVWVAIENWQSTYILENFKYVNATLHSHADNISLKYKTFHDTLRYTPQCFLHAYFMSSDVWEPLWGAMVHIRSKVPELPHVLFIEDVGYSDQNENRREFFVEGLHLTYANHIVMISHPNGERKHIIQFICIPCTKAHSRVTYIKTNLVNFKKYSDLVSHTRSFSTNLFGQMIAAMLRRMGVGDLDHCDFMTRKKPTHISTDLYHTCVHYFLSHRYNYTYGKEYHGGAIAEAIFIVPINVRIAAETVERLSRPGRNNLMEYATYGVGFKRFRYKMFQKAPALPEDLMLRPMTWIVWLLNIIVATVIVLVTLLHKQLQKWRFGSQQRNSAIITSLIASVVDQPMSPEFQNSKIYESRWLGFVWLIWLFAGIITVNGYKGLIFSFLSTGKAPIWPQNLLELVNDPGYCKFSTAGVSNVIPENNGSRLEIIPAIKEQLLEPMTYGRPGVDYPIEYVGLNNSIIFKHDGNLEILKQMVLANFSQPTVEMFQFQNHTCNKFATIDFHMLYFALPLMSFVKGLVMSDSTDIAGYTNFVFMKQIKNFFTEILQKGVAHIEATGLLMASARHASRWGVCLNSRYFYEVMKYDYNITLRHSMFRCLGIMQNYRWMHSTDMTIQEDSEPEKFSLQQMFAVIKVCMVLIMMAFIILVGEISVKKFVEKSVVYCSEDAVQNIENKADENAPDTQTNVQPSNICGSDVIGID